MRMMTRRALALLLLIGLVPATAAAQEPQPAVPVIQGVPEPEIFTRADAEMVLDLDGAIQTAIDLSYRMYQLEQSYLRSQLGVEAARRSLRTQVNLRATLPSISQGINPQLVGNDIYYIRSGMNNARLNVDLAQPLITNGRITLSTGMVGSETFQQLPDRDTERRSFQPSVGISFQQPLFQYNEIKGSLRSAELAFQSIRLSYTEDELARINQVTQQFYNLFRQQRELEIAAERFRQSAANNQTGIRKYQAGLIPEVEYLNLSVRQAEDEVALEQSKNSHQQTQFAFNRLVGLPLETAIWVEADLEYIPIEVDQGQAVERALANRSDVRRAEIQLEQAELSLEQTLSRGRPDLQLNLGYDITGNSGITLTSEDPWSDHFTAAMEKENRSPNTNISLTLRLPVFDAGVNRSNVERQLSSIREQERAITEAEEDLRQQAINQVKAVQSAMKRLEIQEQSVRVTQTAYDITQKRYERGEITFEQLSQSQDTLTRANQQYLSDWIAYQTAKARLRELTLWDWENDRPVTQRTAPPEPFQNR
ncbi:MAG: TolC family protein [bacterium]